MTPRPILAAALLAVAAAPATAATVRAAPAAGLAATAGLDPVRPVALPDSVGALVAASRYWPRLAAQSAPPPAKPDAPALAALLATFGCLAVVALDARGPLAVRRPAP